jgi:hypothetical protein
MCTTCPWIVWSDGFEAIIADHHWADAICVCGQFHTQRTCLLLELSATVRIIWRDTSPLSVCRQAMRDPTHFIRAATL